LKTATPFRLALLGIVSLGGSSSGRGEQALPRQPALETIDQIRRLMHDRRDHLVSIKVEFRSWHQQNLGTARHERSVVAAKGGRRYALLWHGEFSHPEEDPRAYIQLLDGENWNVLNTYFREYDVSRKFAVRSYTDKILFHPVFESLGWWPPDDTNPPARQDGRRFFADDVVDDERCRVVGRELIDGRWCHVVEVANSDRLWIDCARGVVICQKRYASGGDHAEITAMEASDLREVSPGFFLPYRMRRIQRARNLDVTTVIDSYSINEVVDSQFQIEVTPGTLIYDRDTDTYRQVPGGFEVMDRVVRWVKANVQASERSANFNANQVAVMGLGGIAAGVAAAWAQARRGRNLVEKRVIDDEPA